MSSTSANKPGRIIVAYYEPHGALNCSEPQRIPHPSLCIINPRPSISNSEKKEEKTRRLANFLRLQRQVIQFSSINI